MVYTGFVAQDVERAANELGYNFSGVDAAKNEKDLYGLRYAEFVVPLVRAVQELDENQKAKVKSQEEEITKLKTEINDLQKQMEELKSMIVSNGRVSKPVQIKMSDELLVMVGAAISQNIPNPFNRTTTINYTLPQKYSSAKIMVTDKGGKKIKELNLSGNGRNSISVDASNLSSGTYLYSLIIDGKLIDSKQMILIK